MLSILLSILYPITLFLIVTYSSIQMKQQQVEDQMKEDAASVKKDHEDDRKAREKVKAQIAQDR